MKRISLFLSAFIMVAFLSCKNGNENNDEMENSGNEDSTTMDSSSQDAMNDNKDQKITLTKWTKGPQYENAGLKMRMPKTMKLPSGETEFAFDVNNYKLGKQTEGPGNDMLANSDKGQHIHFIVDNEPYSAHYKNDFTKKMSDGDHVVLAFLSRSYHESVKNKDSYAIKHFRVGDVPKSEQMEVNFNNPHMFYSRPKGTYSGDDTNKVLLDFFLLNTDLSPNGNKVKATINGQEFMIDDWKPYIMEGLPMGENTVQLELVDNNGNYIEGPFNKVERTFTLEK